MAAVKKVKLKQVKSAAGAKPGMMETLVGLGLGRVQQTSEIVDNACTRGAIYKVRHLVHVIEQ